jgi:hypothetical protein
MITYIPATYISTASDNDTLVRAGATKLGFIIAGNSNAAARYIKFFDKATAPVSGTDTPVMTIRVPPTGAGAVAIALPDGGAQFNLGLGFNMVTGAALNDSGAVALSDVQLTLGYSAA